jgi:transcriptional regulator with XRE-family HTH domain
MRNPEIEYGDWKGYVELVRKTTGYKTGKLSQLAGVTGETWWRWENRGQKPKDIATVEKFANGFGLDVEEVQWAAGLAIADEGRSANPMLRGLDPTDPVVKKVLAFNVDDEMKMFMLKRHRDNLNRAREQSLIDVEFIAEQAKRQAS